MNCCDGCLHREVCGNEGVGDEALTFCKDRLGWIPVSKKMPNFGDLVFASTDSDYEELKVIITVYECQEYWFNGKIEAWMPRLKKYDPQESEERKCQI